MKQISLRLDDELLALVEKARGQMPRERWIRGVIRRAARDVVHAMAEPYVPPPSSPKTRLAPPGALGSPSPSLERSSSVARSLRSGAHHPTCKCPVCKPPKGS